MSEQTNFNQLKDLIIEIDRVENELYMVCKLCNATHESVGFEGPIPFPNAKYEWDLTTLEIYDLEHTLYMLEENLGRARHLLETTYQNID